MASKLVTINSFVSVSFLCDFETESTKMSGRNALNFLMGFDPGKYNISSFIGDTHLNSIYQVEPLLKLINSVVISHLDAGVSGLTVAVDDYNVDTCVKLDFKLPWVSLDEPVAVSSLRTSFCNLKLFKSSDGNMYTFKGDVPSFATTTLRESYESVQAAYTGFEDMYCRMLESYVSLIEKAGASCFGLPDPMPDIHTTHTDVGDVTVYNDYRLSKYGATTHTVHMSWRPTATRMNFNGVSDLQSWLHKELIEDLWVESDFYR